MISPGRAAITGRNKVINVLLISMREAVWFVSVVMFVTLLFRETACFVVGPHLRRFCAKGATPGAGL